MLNALLPRMKSHSRDTLVRADSDFDRKDVRDACERADPCFAFVCREFTNQESPRAPKIELEASSDSRASRANTAAKQPGFRKRERSQQAEGERAQTQLQGGAPGDKQWIAEVPRGLPLNSAKTYRLVIRRDLIEHYQGQRFLFNDYCYRYIATNLSATTSPQRVVEFTYEHCDQESV